MFFRRRCRYFLLLLLTLISACSNNKQPKPTTAAQAATAAEVTQATAARDLPTTAAMVTHAPGVVNAAQAFFKAWQTEDYPAMYGLTAAQSRGSISADDFAKRYQEAAINMTLSSLDFNVRSEVTNPADAQVNTQVVYHTRLLGDIARDISLAFVMENGSWKILWDDGLILPELKGGNKLEMKIQVSTRGNIYAQDGQPLAANSDIVSLGITFGQTNPDQEGTLVSVLSQLTEKPAAWIRATLNSDRYLNGQYIPIGEALKDKVHDKIDTLKALDGVTWQEYQGRFYPAEGIAPHVTGYVAAIQQGQEQQYQRAGYNLGERVGQNGIEYWGEQYLTGQRGAELRVIDPQGNAVAVLGRVDQKPAQSIYLTIDRDLQLEAQRAIAGFDGAIVVVERNTGRVLAMVSSPTFDPNAFECGENGVNLNQCTALVQIVNDGRKRSYNRATGNGYPLGSVFKVITAAAALESGLVKPEDTLDCQHEYVIDGTVLDDWTKAKGYKPSGVLNLEEGLMRSCDPWFYHIGELLFKNDHAQDISSMARAFGLGSKTGIEGVKEEAGNIPDAPTDPVEEARIAIGQNTVLVNPLQVARFMAAVGNGGTLYQPQVVEKIADADGKATNTFEPKAQGTLPVKPENLKLIQEGLRRVVSDKRGTAVDIFAGLSIPVYGKTGTAQVDYNDPNAWFAGYTNQQGSKPDIAFAVVIENGGEGSEIAAPIARRLVEAYFTGAPQKTYPWESSINVTKTPEPTSTPQP